MRTRAHRLGGQLELHSAADGTCVVLRLPVSLAQRPAGPSRQHGMADADAA